MAAFASAAPLVSRIRTQLTTSSRRPASMSHSTLVSLPVSPFAARCRLLIYDKALDKLGHVSIAGPDAVGGFKSEQHRALAPLGKLPLLTFPDGGAPLYESAVIFDFLNAEFGAVGRSYTPADARVLARSRLITAIVDTYIVPHNPWMYRRVEGDRAAGVQLMVPGWDALEQALDDAGPYVGGDSIGPGDAALWSIMPFYDMMLPTFFGWSVRDGRPKLERWLAAMAKEPNATRVYDEVWGGCVAWWDGGRWDKLGVKALLDPTTLKPKWTADVVGA